MASSKLPTLQAQTALHDQTNLTRLGPNLMTRIQIQSYTNDEESAVTAGLDAACNL